MAAPLASLVLLLAILVCASRAQTATFVITNYCPMAVIAKCATCSGYNCGVQCGQNDTVLLPGDTVTWTGVPNNWNGRVYGHPIIPGIANSTYWDALGEFNFVNSGTFAGGCFFDMSYVDLFVLPTVITPLNSTCTPVGCNASFSASQGKCPKGADYDLTHPSGYGCYCSAAYCSMNNNANANSSYCHRLDAQIAICEVQDPYKSDGCYLLAGPPQITTFDAYAGTPGFSWPNTVTGKGNVYNAALNRGMLSNINSANFSEWYNLYDPTQNCAPQFNEYSKMVRDLCWGTVPTVQGYPYAFSDDDVKNPGATSFCKTLQYGITFCPGDQPGVVPPTPYTVCTPVVSSASATTSLTTAAAMAGTTASASVTAAGGGTTAAAAASTTAAASVVSAASATTAAALTTTTTSSAAALALSTLSALAFVVFLLVV